MESVKRIFQVPELKEKIVFTLLMLVVCRIGGFIPVPGIDGDMVMAYMRASTGGGQNLFQLADNFTGGAFSQMTVTALGVIPYISSSIIMQLMVALFPGFQREMRENPDVGRRKMTRYTRMLTLALSFLQSAMFAKFALQMNAARPGVVASPMLDAQLFGVPILFFMVVMSAMTAGTLFLMWIGEQITESGIGNGISLIITIGILSQLPSAIGTVLSQLNLASQEPGQLSLTSVVVMMGLFVVVTIGTILIIQGQRRIPLQYARRVVGRKEMQGAGSSYLPLKINYAGVIPVIFASSLLMFPATIAQFMGPDSWLSGVSRWLQFGHIFHTICYVLLIIFFTYFWTATQFRPDQIASDMKRNGAFIPGVRQGRPTQVYLETTMNRITLIGALSLALIAILPNTVGSFMGLSANVAYFFGGTSLLIMVGVCLDTAKQIESHLIMKRYEGFMKRGRVRGR